jgi:multidrug efflux pump subunit AcrA (membrane-fusion protein)
MKRMNLVSSIRTMRPLYKWGALAVVVIVALLGWHYSTRPVATENATLQEMAHVHIASVASLSSPSGPLPVTGKVTSRSQAIVLAQSSGQIVSLRRTIGDRVQAGAVIAEMEHSSQSAAVIQAQGAYDAAQAALTKASGATVQNSALTSSQAAQSAQNSLGSVSVALEGMYAALDDAVHAKADTLFSNPRSPSPIFTPTTPDSQLVINIQSERSSLEALLGGAKTLLNNVSAGSADATIDSMVAKARVVNSFLGDVIKASNSAVTNENVSATTLATFQTTVAAARTEVVSAIGSLTSAKAAFDGAQTSSQTAANSASSATGSDIDAAKANLKQAQGALDAARANLEKTIIRSPISGTIVSLPIHQGDFVSAFSQAAQLSNPQALEVDTFVTSDDARTLAVGSTALIDGSTKGVITFIAPAIDPTTNKIEVKIGITTNQDALSDGDTETVSLNRVTSAAKKNRIKRHRDSYRCRKNHARWSGRIFPRYVERARRASDHARHHPRRSGHRAFGPQLLIWKSSQMPADYPQGK